MMINTRKLNVIERKRINEFNQLEYEAPIESQLQDVHAAYTKLKAAIHERIIGQKSSWLL